MRSVRNNYPLPLIIDGLPVRAVAAGTLANFASQVATDRGDIFMVRPMFISPFAALFTGYAGCLYTLTGGGVALLLRDDVEKYSYYADYGADEDQLIRINLTDAQTVEESFDYTQPAVPVTYGTVFFQTVLFYTTPAHSTWLNKFSWGAGLARKRETYFINMPVLGVGQFFLEEVIPTGNGDVVAFSVQVYPYDATGGLLVDGTVNLFIDGVQICRNVAAAYFSSWSQINPYILKVLISEGARFRFEVNVANPLAQQSRAYLTFYYGR